VGDFAMIIATDADGTSALQRTPTGLSGRSPKDEA